MTFHAAFLRGINVGGHRVAGADLVDAFEGLGFEDISTFRASGNVLFDAGSAKPTAEPIEKALAEALGYDVPTFLRSAKQLHAIAGREPFAETQIRASRGKLQVLFLAKKPGKRATGDALSQASGNDLLEIEGRELFWLPSSGTQESELDWKTIGAALGVSTTRTMGTVKQLAAKL